MAERVVASVRAVLTRLLVADCPHCHREMVIDLPDTEAVLDRTQGAGRAAFFRLGDREWEVFCLLRDAAPQWVTNRTLSQVVWQNIITRQGIFSVIKQLEGKLPHVGWRLERRGGAGGTAAFYRVVPADA